ncbi:MAG: immunoglobulin domain-containing protein, partial [Verrucomicrobiales bacterium]|nr:immunoglobulin domain-containing protein [Verrucomicrobiales bacterium]
MKQFLFACFLCLAGLQALAQGTLNFVTKITGSLDAPVYDTDGTTRLSGTAFKAQLYAGPSESTLTPSGAAVSFRTGAGAGYVDTTAGSTREAAGVAAGAQAYVQVRAWDASKGSTYEQALAAGGKTGQSVTLRVTAGGGLLPPANLVGLASFKLQQSSPPVVQTQPASVLVGIGGTARFQVVVTGPTPYRYQWRKNSADITGATSAALEFRSVSAGDAGTYSVRVSNDFGSTESRGATLTIAPIPAITRIAATPSPAQVGKPLRLEVFVEGTGPFTYQWTLNGSSLGGATSPVLETSSASAGLYAVRVTGPGGTAAKDAITVSSQYLLELVVEQGGTIVPTPSQASYASGAVVSLFADADDGYEFSDWIGDVSGTANPVSVTMSGHKRVEARFRTVGGTVYFANRSLAIGLDAPVFDVDGKTRLAGAAYLAQLFAGPSDDTLAPVGDPVAFRDGEGAGYFYSEMRAIPTVPPGQTARVQVRAWQASAGQTYDAAVRSKGHTGRSVILSLVTGNAGSPPTLPTFLGGLTSFSLDSNVAPTSYTLTLVSADGGTASASPTKATYTPGEVVSLSAKAAEGYVFAGWSGDLTGTANPASVTMNANKTITPVFTAEGGTVYVANRVLSAGIDAPIFDTDGKTPLSGDAFLAQLYAGVSEATLAPIAPPSTFRTGDGAGYFLPGNRSIKAVIPGQTAVVEVRAWAASSGATFEAAVAANGKTGSSALLRVTTGNAGLPPTLPGNLVGLASFSLQQATAPRITVAPKPVSVALGNAATFEVTATGSAPLSYLWLKDGKPLSDATSRVLTLPRVSEANVGEYAVRVSNAKGNAESAPVRLTLLSPPSITKVNVVPTPPVPGKPLRIEITAEGSGPLTYLWTRNGSPITGATASVLERAAAEVGTYSVRVTGPGGSTSKDVAEVSSRFQLALLVEQGGKISASPAAENYAPGTVVTLTALPEDGYLFTGWSGDASGTENPTSVRMDAHKSVSATFRPTGGTIYFANRSLALGIDAPIYAADGTTRLSGDRFRAQLFGGPTAGELHPVGEPVAFRTGDGAGYFFSDTRSIPTVTPGAIAFVQVRAWETSGDDEADDEGDDEGDDYAYASRHGRPTGASAVLQIRTGNQGNPPTLPAYLVGLTSFKLGLLSAPTVTILAPPGGIAVGDTAKLLAVATGSKPITFRWYQGSSGNTSRPVGEDSDSFVSQPLLESTSFWVQASNSVSTASSPAVTVTVLRKPQTLAFVPLPPTSLGGSPVTLTAHASSGLPVTYALVSGPATLDGNVLTPSAAGTARVRASQPGNTTYLPATPVETEITILRGKALVLLENLQQIADGSPKQPNVITTPAGLPVTLVFEGRSTPPSAPGTYHVTATVEDPNYSGHASARFQLTPGNNLVGLVFRDLNADGRRQEDESGIEGATLELLGLESDTPLQSTVTNPDGTFSFPGLAPGGYRLREINPEGYVSTTPDLRLVSVRLDAVTEILFGDQPAGTVGGVVYEDADGDGEQDDGEAGLPNVSLSLHGMGTSRTTVTDASGAFEFRSVLAGSYRVEETDPAGFASTTPNTRSVSVSAGGSATASFGDQSVGTVSGSVYADLNANGNREDGEPGISGVTILLTGRDGTLTRTTTDTGSFSFEDLTPGPYTIEEIDPAGYTSTTPNRRTVHVGSRGSASASFGDQELGTV